MSDRVEKRILELLEIKDVSPYGNPIPGLEELGHVSNFKQDGVVAIADLPSAIASQGTVTLRRISEQLQLDADMLADLRAAGVMPGQQVSLTFEAERVGINAAGMKPVWLNRDEAAQLFVDEA